MAYTTEQRETLKAAIAAGTLIVRHGETMLQYRTLDEMLATLALMDAELSPTTRPRRTVARFYGVR